MASACKYYLLPVIIAMCVVGAYGLNNRVFDVVAILMIGLLGYACFKVDYPPVPLLLGFILGPMVEYNLRTSLMTSRGDLTPFITRPISAVFLVLTVTYLAVIMYRGLQTMRRNAGTDDDSDA